MQPSPDEFEEWRGHPVSEWVFKQMRKMSKRQQTAWADNAWSVGDLDERTFDQARVRADAYLAIPDSGYKDWITIDDTEA